MLYFICVLEFLRVFEITKKNYYATTQCVLMGWFDEKFEFEYGVTI
jgi:hypothetical protein